MDSETGLAFPLLAEAVTAELKLITHTKYIIVLMTLVYYFCH